MASIKITSNNNEIDVISHALSGDNIRFVANASLGDFGVTPGMVIEGYFIDNGNAVHVNVVPEKVEGSVFTGFCQRLPF
jgi:hypothetical protein